MIFVKPTFEVLDMSYKDGTRSTLDTYKIIWAWYVLSGMDRSITFKSAIVEMKYEPEAMTHAVEVLLKSLTPRAEVTELEEALVRVSELENRLICPVDEMTNVQDRIRAITAKLLAQQVEQLTFSASSEDMKDLAELHFAPVEVAVSDIITAIHGDTPLCIMGVFKALWAYHTVNDLPDPLVVFSSRIKVHPATYLDNIEVVKALIASLPSAPTLNKLEEALTELSNLESAYERDPMIMKAAQDKVCNASYRILLHYIRTTTP